MLSPTSTGKPYRLAVASHKGGTGRTTLALGLAWVLGEQGARVVLADADPTRSASLIACDEAGACRWRNVRVCAGPAPDVQGADVVLIDCPALNERAALSALRSADGVLLTCLADTLFLRTLPAATVALAEARAGGSQAALLGLVVNLFDGADVLQQRLFQQIAHCRKPPLLGPPIPMQPTVRDWALHPGSPMPAGPARAALLELAFCLRNRLPQVQEIEV
jgi:cellulose biosynthesis protein BcsQ